MKTAPAIAAVASISIGAPTLASDLSYTFVDFGATNVDVDVQGVQTTAASQTVSLESAQGDGLLVAGSLALGRRFYMAASYESAVVEVDAVVTSPLAVAMTSGDFDLITTHTAIGYLQPIGERLDFLIEASYDSVEYDFGSFAGESFDVDDAGAGVGVGLRWNPGPALELYATAYHSSVGDVDLTSGLVDAETRLLTGVRWYFFEDLGLGFDYRTGESDSLTVSIRFGFGELRAGGN